MLPEPPTKLNVTRRVFPFQGNRIVPPKDDVEMMPSAEYSQGEELEGKTGRKMKMKAKVSKDRGWSQGTKERGDQSHGSRRSEDGGRRTEYVSWQRLA